MTSAEPVAVPSGKETRALEYFADQDGTIIVFRARYIAPWLTGNDDLDIVFSDMKHLCETDAVPERDELAPDAAKIIVSLSSEMLEFGAIDADVTQYFEAYSVEDGDCLWELH